jgi:monoamine oxidase
MDRIPHALADAIVGRIRYGVEVRGITTRDADVEVIAWDGKEARAIVADYCICTIPPMILSTIPTNLPTAVQVDLGALRGVPVAKMGLEYRRRFWEEDEGIFGGITDTNMDLNTIWYPSYGYLGERGVLIGYYNFFGNADAYGTLSPKDRERRALEQGAKIHGDAYTTEFLSSFSAHWAKDPHSRGGWVEWPDRESPAGDAMYRRLLEPQGRLYFAGDHLSHVTSWQHGAFESARAVVTQLHQRVLAG